MSESSVAEELVMALGMALVRAGHLDLDDIVDAAERAAMSGSPHAGTVAHLLNVIGLCADAPSPADWQAEQRRKQIRIVSADGGNDG